MARHIAAALIAALLLPATLASAFEFFSAPGTTEPTLQAFSITPKSPVAYGAPAAIDVGCINSGCGRAQVFWDPDADGLGTTPGLSVSVCPTGATDISSHCGASVTLSGADAAEFAGERLCMVPVGVPTPPTLVEVRCLDPRP